MTGSILKISDAASIALHALVVLAKKKDKLISVKEIATSLDVSANHLSKIMQRLTKAGYVESIKGFNGGFKLTVEPEKITFLEVYELFDGKLRDADCLLSHKRCKDGCVLGELVYSINKQVRQKFEDVRISDFLKCKF